MRIALTNFTGGEIAPTLSARYDLARYVNSLQCMENFMPNLHGAAERRPGTTFVADLGGAAVLLPFSFSAEGHQNFVLVVGEKSLRVAAALGKGLLPSATLSTPYTVQQAYEISYAQVGDVVYMAHRSHPLHKLTRRGSAPNYQWSLNPVSLNISLSAPGTPSAGFSGEGSGYILRYKVVAVDDSGRESLPSGAGECNGKHPSDWVVGNSVHLSWEAVSGAVEYNIYREEAGYYGFIGISKATSFIDNNYQADVADTPCEDWDPFKNNNHPGVVAFHQQRMVLAATPQTPQAFYMSRAGDYENFRKSRPLKEDDPVEYLIASGSIDAITWAASFGDLLLGTSGSEYKATGGDGGPISATSISITAQSYWGSANLPPIIIGNSILHVQRHGARVRDLFYSLEKDGYAGNDLSIMAPHLFDGHVLKQWAYQQTPGSTIWVVRGDGVLLALTYMKEHDIWGWSRHVTEGKVLSVATVSGDDGDVLMAVVQREVGGTARYYLERMAPRWTEADGIEEAFFVDCGITWRGEAAVVSEASTSAPGGRAVARDSAGDAFAELVSANMRSDAEAGDDCGITWRGEAAVVSEASTSAPGGRAVARDSAGDAFAELASANMRSDAEAGDDCGITWRGEAAAAGETATVGNLAHLEGRAVAVLADGSPVDGCVVREGRIELPFAASVVHVGLPFTSTLAPLPVELQGQSGSTLGRKRAYGACSLRMHASVGGKYGADRDTLHDFPFVPSRWGEACELFSGDVEFIPGGGQDTRSTLWLVQDRPLPLQVVAITAEWVLGQE